VKSWILSFGETARVIEPKELADAVVKELRGALAAYDGRARA
jgi:predicted DNA-binding transcriptional regulator YafY